MALIPAHVRSPIHHLGSGEELVYTGHKQKGEQCSGRNTKVVREGDLFGRSLVIAQKDVGDSFGKQEAGW